MKVKVDDNFMIHFRWITPLIVSIVSVLVTLLLFVVSQLISEIRILRSDLKMEIRNVRVEVIDSRNFSMNYTDKMIELANKNRK